jgi:hypothetical protein
VPETRILSRPSWHRPAWHGSGWRLASPLLLIAWQAISSAGLVSTARLPPPEQVWRTAISLVTSPSPAYGSLQGNLLASLERVATGFACGAAAAIVLAVTAGLSEPPAQVAAKIAWMRELAQRAGRDLRFGIRLHVITRDTAEQAWAEASRMLDTIDPAEIEVAQQALGRSESVGQRRMRALHSDYRASGTAAGLEIYPNLWAGVGLVRGGAGTALVGSHEQVAERISEYAALGIEGQPVAAAGRGLPAN